jgi:DNA-binding response OmpR family regulator
MPVVLIVENDRDLLEAIAESIGSVGWTPYRALSLEQALRLATSCEIDVVLADVGVQGEVGRALQNAFDLDPRLRSIPLVFMTASPSGRGAGVSSKSAAVIKPFDLAEVITTLTGRLPRAAPQRPGQGPPP